LKRRQKKKKSKEGKKRFDEFIKPFYQGKDGKQIPHRADYEIVPEI